MFVTNESAGCFFVVNINHNERNQKNAALSEEDNFSSLLSYLFALKTGYLKYVTAYQGQF